MKAKKTAAKPAKPKADPDLIKKLAEQLEAMLESQGLNHPPHNDLVTEAKANG